MLGHFPRIQLWSASSTTIFGLTVPRYRRHRGRTVVLKREERERRWIEMLYCALFAPNENITHGCSYRRPGSRNGVHTAGCTRAEAAGTSVGCISSRRICNSSTRSGAIPSSPIPSRTEPPRAGILNTIFSLFSRQLKRKFPDLCREMGTASSFFFVEEKSIGGLSIFLSLSYQKGKWKYSIS